MNDAAGGRPADHGEAGLVGKVAERLARAQLVALYRPLVHDTTRVELAAAWRREDQRPVLMRALDVIRRELGAG